MYSYPHNFGTPTPIILGIFASFPCHLCALNESMNVAMSAPVVALDADPWVLGSCSLFGTYLGFPCFSEPGTLFLRSSSFYYLLDVLSASPRAPSVVKMQTCSSSPGPNLLLCCQVPDGPFDTVKGTFGRVSPRL